MPVTINHNKIPVKAARVLLGMKGHKPSLFNIKVGKCMKRKGIGPHNGGMHDKDFQAEFLKCCIEAGAKLSDETYKKWAEKYKRPLTSNIVKP